MKKIYLVPLENNQLPVIIGDYTHVKMNNFGQLGIIISEYELPYEWLLESIAQEILDSWINQENETPWVNADGENVYQNKINLGVLLG